MKRKILFPLLVTLGFALIAKIPIKQMYIKFGLGESAVIANMLTKATIIGILVFVLVRKFQLVVWGGFRKPVKRNTWMLLLPLVYPGIWTYSNLGPDCLLATIWITATTVLIHGILEEIVFRGLIHGYILKTNVLKSKHHIALLTSLLFSLGHFLNLTHGDFAGVFNQVIYAFFMGMLFSAIQFRVNNIWLLGIVHGLLNFLFSGCNTSPQIVDDAVSYNIWDYLANLGGMILVFSPTLIIYWFLMKKIKIVGD